MVKLRKAAAVLLIIVFFTSLIAAGCGRKKAVQPGAQGVVATVNGIAITEGQMTERLEEFKAYAQSQGLDLTNPAHQNLLEEMRKDALNQLIEEALFLQAAEKERITVTDQEVAEQLQSIKAGMPAEVYQEALKAQNLTEDKLKERIRMVLLQDALYKKITDQVTVSPQEVKEYFEQNRDSLVQIKVRHILYMAQEGIATEEEKKQALDKANKAIEELKKGADFAAMAKEQSDDPGSRAAGGLLDYYFTKDDPYFVPEFVAGAFLLDKGAFSQTPVKSSFGYHIIKVEDKRDSLEDLKGQVEGMLLASEKNRVFGEYYEKLEAEAVIEKK
ncbi:MAG: peptidylprolyl isomerase [Bacillota bacterium]